MFQALAGAASSRLNLTKSPWFMASSKITAAKEHWRPSAGRLWKQGMGHRSAQTAPAAQRERQELLRALLRMAYKVKGRDLFGGPVRYNLPVGELRLSDELPYSLELLLYVSRGSRVR